jgi:hypothetical protein
MVMSINNPVTGMRQAGQGWEKINSSLLIFTIKQ